MVLGGVDHMFSSPVEHLRGEIHLSVLTVSWAMLVKDFMPQVEGYFGRIDFDYAAGVCF